MPVETQTAVTAPFDEETLVRQHLPIVQYEVADLRRRLPEHVNVDDLTSAGMAALALAARSYDPAHGVSFGRYAARRISGALLDELRAHDWASRSVRRRARSHAEGSAQLSQALGRPASTDELARHLGVPVTEVEAAEQDVHRAVVLSWQALVDVTGEEPAVPSEAPTPEAVLLSREREAYLHDAVASLPQRLHGVIQRLYFEDATLQDVAMKLDVTESRVSQMRTETISLLRDAMHAHLSPEQLEPEALPDGRVARRKAAYYATIASRSGWQARLTAPAPLVGSRFPELTASVS
jgi:RNA polymerase sigma factor for flagellar operon FliA